MFLYSKSHLRSAAARPPPEALPSFSLHGELRPDRSDRLQPLSSPPVPVFLGDCKQGIQSAAMLLLLDWGCGAADHVLQTGFALQPAASHAVVDLEG